MSTTGMVRLTTKPRRTAIVRGDLFSEETPTWLQ